MFYNFIINIITPSNGIQKQILRKNKQNDQRRNSRINPY